ncbi:DUF2252 domain-containing protein [Pseudoclavibacter caeni]|uniref:DUF2252 domain-containing protein n=1 Tax=Pseudoclavibacter caeni TaxID=908846 RepID=A0A7C8BPQ1_9MICO|nr:DUF2252 domain-containing protein [Pseudoclavibacter caeni]
MTGVTGADGGVRMSRGIYSTTDEVREHLTAKQQRREGKLARACQPFERLATFHPVDRDPVALLAEQNRTRLPDLIGLRWQRMAASAFTFYRGSARLMAHDLAAQEDTGQQIVICGDAHISNFGLFASPERRLVFDLNDFDEAAPGPWEWDVRRLVTSVVLGARRRVRRRGGQPPRAADCAGLPAGDTEAVALVGARPLLRERRRRHDRRPDAQLVGQGVPAGGGQGPLAHGGAGGAADDGAGRDGRAPLCRAAARAPARHRGHRRRPARAVPRLPRVGAPRPADAGAQPPPRRRRPPRGRGRQCGHPLLRGAAARRERQPARAAAEGGGALGGDGGQPAERLHP